MELNVHVDESFLHVGVCDACIRGFVFYLFTWARDIAPVYVSVW